MITTVTLYHFSRIITAIFFQGNLDLVKTKRYCIPFRVDLIENFMLLENGYTGRIIDQITVELP